MSIGLLFWILFLIGVLFSGYVYRGAVNTPLIWGGSLLLWVMIFLLGWQTFGAPVR